MSVPMMSMDSAQVHFSCYRSCQLYQLQGSRGRISQSVGHETRAPISLQKRDFRYGDDDRAQRDTEHIVPLI